MKVLFVIFIVLIKVIYANKIENRLILYPVDTYSKIDNSANVIQGVCKLGKYYITTQSVKNKNRKDSSILINVFNENGYSLANIELPFATHAYDLSVEEINNKVYLYTVGEHGNNLLRFKVTLPKYKSGYVISKKLNISLDKKILLPKENQASTGITLSEDKNYIVAVSRKYKIVNHKVKIIKGTINVYSKKDLLSGNDKVVYSLQLDNKQLNEYIQGIAMKDKYIYVLSGDNSILKKKRLVVYNIEDKTKYIKTFLPFKDRLKIWSKMELEGLYIEDNKLVTTVNVRELVNKKNIKYIYPILTIKE